MPVKPLYKHHYPLYLVMYNCEYEFELYHPGIPLKTNHQLLHDQLRLDSLQFLLVYILSNLAFCLSPKLYIIDCIILCQMCYHHKLNNRLARLCHNMLISLCRLFHHLVILILYTDKPPLAVVHSGTARMLHQRLAHFR
jgi:hypothetical protein